MRTTLATLALLGLFASNAYAQTETTTIGQLANSTGAYCKAATAYMQGKAEAGQPSYTVPAPGGIITAWSELPLSGSGPERLLIGAPTASAGQYTVVALSPAETVTGTEPQTFAVHIPVQSGDVLGLQTLSPTLNCQFHGFSGDLVEVIPGEHSEGETLTSEPKLAEAEERLNLTATLQPDACPTDPSTEEACPVPVIGGLAAVGQTLTANPQGHPENASYAWLRCANAGSSCYAIPGATGLTYTIEPLDVGHTLRFAKTATSGQYTQETQSSPTALVPFVASAAVTPRLSSVSQSASHWREGNAQVHFSRRSRTPIGTTFSFTVNLPVPVTLTFKQKVTGRLVGGKCVAQTKHNEHRRACARIITVGALRATAHVAKNKVAFQGRLSPSKKLSPALYTVTITAGSGSHSASRSLTFRILGP
jgi:hypothetical protein